MVLYNALSIERVEQNNRKNYKAEDYQKLDQFYENKVQQIHIVGEYAKKMISDYKDALQFVEDYFHLNYPSFLNRYFKGSRQNDIKKNITPVKFKQLFGELSPTQLKIINDKDSKYIVVAAGPGSGKTRILVHKLASLLLMEDVKHEQLLMVTFSRAAATEFKKRLLKLIGNAANFIEIKTFHSYCFDLLGRVGTLEKSADIVQKTIKRIKSGDVEQGRVTKTVGRSINLEICINIIKDFEATNPKSKYKSDLEVFIRESKLEDFLGGNSETIFVSTIHKAKGREFENVFLMLDEFKLRSEEAIRQLYVAMTRAKRNLTIHYNGNYLQFIKTEGLERVNDSENYLPPSQLAMQLTYKDVWLDYFLSSQPLVSHLNSGDELTVDRGCCRNSKGQVVLKFSKQLIKQIEERKHKNSLPKAAKIRFIVYWQKENSEREIRIVLPELYFERTDLVFDYRNVLGEHNSRR